MKDNKILISILSFLFPGLGHIILSNVKKGVLLLIVAFGLMFLSIGIPFFSFILLPLTLYAILDCMKIIEKRRTANEKF